MRWRRRSALDRDRDEEFAAHLAEAIDYYKAQGLSDADAARQARLRFGNPRAYREALDELQRLPVLDVMARDLRYALRRLRQAPGFHAVIIVTLALVIGATGAVFSLADALLLRPLPLPDPDRLFIVGYRRVSSSGDYIGPAVDGAMWATVRDRARAIDAAISSPSAEGVNFVIGTTPSFVQSRSIGAGYFRVLGVAPLIGRELTAEEARAGGPAVAILSHGFWRRALNGRADLSGQTILLRGEPYAVVGVMPAGLPDFEDVDVWTPLRGAGQGLNYRIIARLARDATVERANAELAALGDEPFAMQRPTPLVQRSLVLMGLQHTLTDAARQPIALLGWAVVGLLVIACVNIAALLLARGASRAGEIGIRLALGGTRGAVVRQLMIEALVVAAIGGAAGVAVASAGLEALKAIGGATFADWTRASLNARTVVVSLGIASTTSVLFGLLPAWQGSRVDVQTAYAAGGSRSIAGGSRHLLRRALVVAEVALGVVMLIAGGLLLRQLLFLYSLDPGFAAERLYTASASLQDARYREAGTVRRLFAASLARLEQTPGIEAASISQGLPYQRLLNIGFRLAELPDEESRITNVCYLTPGFFDTFGIRIVDGRPIDNRDREDTPPVVLVNDTFRRIHLHGEAAVGRSLRFGSVRFEVVGVIGDVQQFGAGFSLTGMRRGPIVTSPTVYFPAAQADGGLFRSRAPVWTVRARSAAGAASAIAAAIHAADPLLPIGPVRAMEGFVGTALAQPRLVTLLVGTLALAALLLSALGLQGLMAHVVSERTREFGIRLALGAAPVAIVARVAMAGVALAMVGAVLGLALSLPAGSLVASFLPDLGTRDGVTYAWVAGLFVLVALASCVLPALRIGQLDPVRILRE